MSLSTGPNSQKFTFDLQGLRNLYQTNQVKGIDSAKGVGNGIPLHVTDVKASTSNAATGTTNVVTVTFRRNPTDPNFQRANVYVQGYNGSQAPVLVVSSADSPATVVLNNTGEAIRIIVQAAGNGGAALLTTAPTTGVQLPKSTSGGYGSSTKTSTSIPNYTGDLSVAGSVATVVGIQTRPVTATAPLDSQSLTYVAANADWEPIPTIKPGAFYWRPGGNASIGTGILGFTGIAVSAQVNATTADIAPTDTTPPMLALKGGNTSGNQNWLTDLGATANSRWATVRSLRLLRVGLKLAQTTNMRIWIVLSDRTTDANTDFTSDNPAFNTIGFRFSTTTDTKWVGYASTTALAFTATAGSGTGSTPDTGYHILEMRWDGTNVNYYVDGNRIAQVSTNLPAANLRLGFRINIDNKSTANATEVDLAHIYAELLKG